MERKKIFITFLKENHAFEQYMYNFKFVGKRYNHVNKCFNKLINLQSAESYIDNAFTWDDTKEGFEFWYRLHLLWVEYYKYLNHFKYNHTTFPYENF